MLKMIEIIIGAILIAATMFYGTLRVVKVPKGYAFSHAATVRYVIFTMISLAGGVALLAIGLLQ